MFHDEYMKRMVESVVKVDKADEDPTTATGDVYLSNVPPYQQGRKGSARVHQEGRSMTFRNRKIIGKQQVTTGSLAVGFGTFVGMTKINNWWLFVVTHDGGRRWIPVNPFYYDRATGLLKNTATGGSYTQTLPEPRGTGDSVLNKWKPEKKKPDESLDESRMVGYARLTSKGMGEVVYPMGGRLVKTPLDNKSWDDPVVTKIKQAFADKAPGLYSARFSSSYVGQKLMFSVSDIEPADAKRAAERLADRGEKTKGQAMSSMPGVAGVAQRMGAAQGGMRNRSRERRDLYQWLTGENLPESL